MKKINLLLSVFLLLALVACENPMSFRTKVNEDGSLDKTIILAKADANYVTQNPFGINEANGWSLKKSKPADSTTTKTSELKYRLEFNRHFESDAKMNEALDGGNDSLFRVHARFEKKFRWFYTYIRYSETIRPINRFKKVAPVDYFNREDSLFIERLPAEGKTISSADSLYLQLLNEKISDHFANMGLFLEMFEVAENVLKKNNVEKRWLDTLYRKRDFIYNLVIKDQIDFSAKKMIDTLGIPVPKEQAEKDFRELSRGLNSRISFMSFARDGKYLNEFEMPWQVVKSNADSVAGKTLYWRPLVHKFLFTDYEMFVESRQLNWWAVIVSLVILGLTILAFRKKAR